MLRVVSQIQKSSFIRNNIIFFFGSIGVGFLNYLFYPVLGHLLRPSNFGEVQTLSSIFAQVLIFLSVAGLITVNIVANYEDENKINKLIIELEHLSVILAIGLLAITVVMSGFLKSFFHFGSSLPFPLLAVAFLASVPLTFQSAYLRGTKHFGIVSVVSMVGSAFDIIMAVVFVLLGLKTSGAIIGLALGAVIEYLFATYQARRFGFNESWHFRLPDIKVIRPELKYAALVLVGSLGITILYSLDIIVVKHYFSGYTAGLYAGVSTVARIIFFLTASIAQVLVPSVKIRNPNSINRSILLKSLLLTVLVGGLALITFFLIPRFIIGVLMGSKYLPLAYILPRLSFALFVISILNLLLLYFMALRNYQVGLIVIVGLLATFLLIRFHHQTIEAIISDLLYGSVSMFGMLAIWFGVNSLKASNIYGG